jgi:hypothetical protein
VMKTQVTIFLHTFRDGKADKLLAGKYIWEDSGFELFRAKVENWWKTDNFATQDSYIIRSEVVQVRLVNNERLIPSP